jgi:hypothetical protein
MDEDTRTQLIAEQLSHTLDLIRFEIKGMRSDLAHFEELSRHRLSELEDCNKDHEMRLRTIKDDVVRNKTQTSLISGGSTFVSFIALIRSFLVF